MIILLQISVIKLGTVSDIELHRLPPQRVVPDTTMVMVSRE